MQQDPNENKTLRNPTFLSRLRFFRDLIFLLSGIAALLLVLYYIIFPSRGYFHSDCSDYLLWAAASVDSGSILNPSFHYAGLLPFGAPLWTVPLIHLFGVSMTTHILAMCIFAVLFAFSALFFLRSIGWSYPKCSFGIFLLLLTVSCSDKLREIFHMHVLYYSLGPVFLFLLLGLSSRILSALRFRKWSKLYLYAVLSLLLAYGCGFDGFQIIALSVLPASAALLADLFFSEKADAEKAAEEKKRSIAAVSCAGMLPLFSYFGLKTFQRISDGITSGYATSFSEWSEPSAWFTNLSRFPEKYFTLLGVDPEANAPLASMESLLFMLRILFGILLLILPIVSLIRWRKLSHGSRILLAADLTVTAVVLFGFCFGKLSGLNWRLSPILVFHALVSVDLLWDVCIRGSEVFSIGKPENASLSNASFGGGRTFRRLALLCFICLLCFSLIVSGEIMQMPADYGLDNDLWQLAAILEEEELTYGYATFWTSQALTVICGCAPRVVNVVINQSVGCQPGRYQSDDNWYLEQPNVDRYFIIANEHENGEYRNLRNSKMWRTLSPHLVDTIEYGDGKYYILIFDCYIWGLS